MKIIPAIDILDGKVVRLFKGSFDESKEYGDDPKKMAQFWQEEGAEYLHIVDLDGAKTGRPRNQKIIKKMIKSLDIPVEIGGGIRSTIDIEAYLKFGADRVVLGTAIVNDLAFLEQKEVIDRAERIAVSCDSKTAILFGKDVSTASMTTGTVGWVKEHKINLSNLFNKMAEIGIKYLNYTVRSKDGTLTGLAEEDMKSLDSFLNLIGDKDIKVIYAGGIADLKDIEKLAHLKNKKLEGVIVGKALYENRFTLKDAKKVADVS